MKSKRDFSLLLTAVVLLICPVLSAQTASTGSIKGTVQDEARAVIPDVIVHAVSSTTGIQRSSITDGTGNYNLSLLPPGAYQLEFSAKGFKTASPAPVTVNVTEISTVNIAMSLGTQQQTVQVMAEAVPLVQAESATLGTVVEGKTIQTVPLTERNYTQVLTMSPGVAGDVNNAASLGKGTQDVYVNGTSNISNNFHMDGADINNFGSGRSGDFVQQAGIAIPNPDTIQEFKIQTTLYDAGYGRDAGANVDVVTKSGTNQFHGNLFEFLRNTKLDANDPFLKGQGQARPEMKQNQFGGTFGGPVLKNKLFFFGSYQGTRQVNGLSPSSFSSNTLPALTNDRSAAALGRQFCGQSGIYGGTRIACDGSNINPVALNFLNYKLSNGTYLIPTPQQIRTGSNGGLIGFSSYSIPAHFREDQYLVNTDYIISEKHRLEQRYFHSYDPQNQPFSSCSAGCTPGAGVATTFNNDVATLKFTSALSPSFVNEALVSFIRNTGVLVSEATQTAQTFGITPGNPSYPLMPTLTINGLFSLGGGGNDNSFSAVNTYEAGDQISFTHGRHTLRAGFDYERQQFNFDDPNILRGSMSFQSFPDFLLGLSAAQNGSIYSNVFSSTAAQGNYYKAYRAYDMAAFVQDDYKVNTRLTLNMGLRWELNGGVSEAHGNMSSVFPSLLLSNPLPTAAGSFAGYVVPSNYPYTLPSGVTKLSGKTLARNGLPLHNFGPRFGFAWQPLPNSNRLVVRGGYGVFYTRPNGNSILQTLSGQPFVSRIGLSGASDAAATFQAPFVANLTPGSWAPRTPTSQQSATLVAENYDSPLTQQYNFDVQGQIAPNTVLEAGYVGTKSSRLMESRALNAALLASPINSINGVTTNTVANAYLRVPYVGFSPTGLTSIETYGASLYNSLQATLKRQLSHGVQFQIAYTWSKIMTNVQGSGINAVFAGGSGNSNDPNNRAQMWGPAAYDRTHRVVLVYLWNIPSLTSGALPLRKALSNWTFSGVTTIQTGTPLTITDSRAGSIYGFASTARAQLCPGVNYDQLLTGGSVGSRVNNYFNTAGFCVAPSIGNGTGYGNSGVGIVRGPGQNNFDLALAKTTHVGGLSENGAVEFRSEFFNAFNRVQYSNPGTAYGTASFGVIGSTSVAARLIQFALKYNF